MHFSPTCRPRGPTLTHKKSRVPRKTEKCLMTEKSWKTQENTKKCQKTPKINAGKRLKICIFKTEDIVLGVCML